MLKINFSAAMTALLCFSFAGISEVFQAPYDNLILRDSLPTPGIQMFQPDYLTGILADSLHPIRQDLRDNNVCNRKPDIRHWKISDKIPGDEPAGKQKN
ncbi:MAG: hypothetical protein L6Q97_12025 [Thermoanaerobaculia bacterium]|nr:hypothetical protein [Thermoanaerobaculia bacterium]